jgi:hypothetical protein
MDLPQIPVAEDVTCSEVCVVKNGKFLIKFTETE